MARKSIKGYAEKNYYDNTRFQNGIIATNDPLNEGSFKHLVNFDISDMGQSLTPRKGFLTTMMSREVKEDNITRIVHEHIGTNTIYFYDENIGYYIFLTRTDNETTPYKAYKCPFDKIKDGYIEGCVEITNIDFGDLGPVIFDIINYNTIRLVDELGVTCYVTKVKLHMATGTTNNIWLKMYYNNNTDTLYMSYLNTSDIGDYVNTSLRNIASGESIIPNPIQDVYVEPNKKPPEGHVDRLPIIYAKQGDDYLINTYQTKEGITLIPNFYLKEPSDTTHTWAYMYDVISTNQNNIYSSTEDKTYIYNSPAFYLSRNIIFEAIPTETYKLYITSQKYVYNTATESSELTAYKSLDEYKVYINNLESLISQKKPSFDIYPDYVIYIVPYYNAESIIYFDLERFDKEEYKGIGPSSIVSMFSNVSANIVEDTLYDLSESQRTQLDHHNYIVRNYSIYNLDYCCRLSELKLPEIESETIVDFFAYDIYGIAGTDEIGIYVEQFGQEDVSINDTKETTLSRRIASKLTSNIYTWNEQPMLLSDFIGSEDNKKDPNSLYYKVCNARSVIIKYLPTKSIVQFSNASSAPVEYNKIFPNIGSDSTYYIYTTHWDQGFMGDSAFGVSIRNQKDIESMLLHKSQNSYNKLFYLTGKSGVPTSNTSLPLLEWNESMLHVFKNTENKSHSLFEKDENGILKCTLNSDNEVYTKLNNAKFFDTGININFYLIRVPNSDNTVIVPETYTRDFWTNSTSLKLNRMLMYDSATPSKYVLQLTEQPELIKNSENSLVFDSALGKHLVTYINNKVFISVENKPYYFIQDYMKEYPEPVVKVIAYKDMLLVFTTQNLYAIYLYETVINVANGTDAEGNVKYVQQTVYNFATLPVLYNLMVDSKYKNVIQVYNQMILFYSADGQLFLIKPTAAIDSNTRFSIQYFNKSTNDILLNYKDYMQERLYAYGSDKIIDNVEITATANINYIKIYYCAPGIMTYVLIYDVINNRYTTYDTLSFTQIKDIQYIPTGEMYITEHSNGLYFTTTHNNVLETDSNVDITCYNNFSPSAINAEIDTGTINLNNHLKKRFKDLRVIYKNLNANEVEFSLDTYVDDIPIMTHIESNLEIRNIAGCNTLVTLDTNKVTQLINKLEEAILKEQLITNNALFNFTDYTSNKIITHKSNIISKGKTIRIKMNFTSKGKYKIQGFGIIYKEHTV